jgi:glycosyltransferase involved in cell wall biosynthesis
VKLGVLSTHPIQYQAPWFRAMAACADLELEVFFCHRASPSEQANAGFGVAFDWDIPLTEGYRHRFLRNVATQPSLGAFFGLDTPEIRGIIAGGRFDAVIVHGWYYKSAWQAIRACWATKTPVMVRSDSHLRSPRNTLTKLVKSVPYRWFIPRFGACLAAGKWSADYFLHYGARQEKVFFVPHVIDEARFRSECSRLQPCRGDLRREWNLSENGVVFLFAGKFIDKKRPVDFVRAVDRAVRGGARIEGLMVGDGPLRQECERIANEARTPVRFAGFLNQSQIVSAYVACDALVLPSDGGETWGLVVNEAMVCGRPCIVSDRVGCGPDLITLGETGFVFPLGDLECLASLMAKCAGDKAALAKMGAAARERVARYSTSVAVEGVLRAVEAVKTSAGGPGA